MPRKSSPDEPEKVQRLSLTELASHDDVCSDAMIDNAYFTFKIRKYRPKHVPLRGIKEDEVPQILLHKVFVAKDLEAAEKALLKVSGLKRYRRSLRTKAEQEHFIAHLRRYIEMYSTDCAWEVSTTNRYTITTYEAAVTARRRIKQGQTIKYLTGTLVPLTTEQSNDLDITNRNFSIVVSSRKKNSSIFLGPARFANHDCDANGRLVMKGTDGMEVIAMKNIDVGDEITVSYGDDYFGPGNIDCLCHTCEVLERNGWTSKEVLKELGGIVTTPAPEAISIAGTCTTKRRREIDGLSETSWSSRGSKRVKVEPSPSKLRKSWTPMSATGSVISVNRDDPDRNDTAPVAVTEEVNDQTLSPPRSPSKLREENNIEQQSSYPTQDSDSKILFEGDDVEQVTYPAEIEAAGFKDNLTGNDNSRAPKKLRTSLSIRGNLPLSPDSSAPSTGERSSDEQIKVEAAEAEAEQEDNSTITLRIESMDEAKIEADIFDLPASPTSESSASRNPVTEGLDGAAQVVSNVTTTEIIQSTKSRTIPNSDSTILPSIEPEQTTIAKSTTASIRVHPLSDSVRIPGDYALTRKLLAQPHDRWVQCHNQQCLGFFVQANGYQTRRECPRCERHSKLYGFEWPKTDPDPRKMHERKKEFVGRGKKGEAVEKYSAYRRQGRCGKGTWVEGGGDEEERVMDHRTIHRFVLAEEERDTTRRGLLNQAEKARAIGDDHSLLLDGRRSRGTGTDSVGFDGAGSESARGSATPDDFRRRSSRFVTRVGVYTDS